MRVYRRNGLERIKQFVGFNYKESGSDQRQPINLMELAVNIFRRGLVAANPSVLAVTDDPNLKPEAATFELVINQMIRDLDLQTELDLWVMDAMFGLGIMVHGVASCEQAADFEFGYGQPFAETVSPDDWVHDMAVTKWSKIGFCGHRIGLPLDYVQTSGEFDERVVADLQPERFERYSKGGSLKRKTVGGAQAMDEPYLDMVYFWQLWLPFKGQIVTVTEDGFEQVRPAIKYDGPRTGPYERLVFTPVPDSTLPLPPTALWQDMSQTANDLFRRITKQSKQKKTVVGVQPAAQEDAARMLAAEDGEFVKITNPNAIASLTTGGIDQQNGAFVVMVKDLFSYFAGNLDTLGGLSTQADTLGQEQLLSGASSRRMQEMQAVVESGTKRVISALAGYRWRDPVRVDKVRKEVPGTPYGVTSHFAPIGRAGKFGDYRFELVPYSMQSLAPAQRLQTLARGFQTFIGPLMPLLQAQGKTVSVDALVRILAKYTNMSEWNEIIVAVPQPGQEQAPPDGPQMQPETTRNYVRRNVPGRSRQGADQALAMALFGKGVQPSEMAGAVRTAG